MSHVESGNGRWSGIDIIAFAIPPVLILVLLGIYLVSPSFYLKYVLEHVNREKQFVEVVTYVAALLAAPILVYCAIVQWRTERRRGGSLLPGAAIFMLLVAAAAFFFGGEELSWGQTIFKWKTPADMTSISRETNLHNGRLGHLVHMAGNLFLVGMFIALPIVWRWHRRLRLPADWRAGIPEWPVLACIVLAMLLRGVKLLYMTIVPAAHRDVSEFYFDYLGEISEQKEMLVSIAMFMYACYRVPVVRRERQITVPA